MQKANSHALALPKLTFARQKNRGVRRAILAAAGLLLLGTACSSYRICGFAGGGMSRSASSGRHFQIADLRISFASSEKDTRFVFTSAALSPRGLLIDRIHATRPDVFSSDDGAEKINVNFVMKSCRVEGQASILLYIFSLGILPTWEDCISEGEVEVSLVERQGQDGNDACSPLRFESNQKLTCYSPIGLIPYDDRHDAVATRKQSFAFVQSSDDLNTVFVRTAADAIAKAVTHLQKRKLQHVPVTTNVRKVETENVVKKVLSVKPESEFEMIGNEPAKCSICGAVKDANGKCPLCD